MKTSEINNINTAKSSQEKIHPRRLLLLGIGNILYGDEGIGVHFINYISDKYNIENPAYKFDIVDGGTLAHGLIPMLATYDELIVVDTINSQDGEIGDVYFFNFDNTPPDVDWQGSAHEVEMLQTLIMMDMVGDRPNTFVLGVIPTVIEPMFMGLTPQITNAVATMEQQLLRHLTHLGFTLTIKKSITINDVIQDAQKR